MFPKFCIFLNKVFPFVGTFTSKLCDTKLFLPQTKFFKRRSQREQILWNKCPTFLGWPVSVKSGHSQLVESEKMLDWPICENLSNLNFHLSSPFTGENLRLPWRNWFEGTRPTPTWNMPHFPILCLKNHHQPSYSRQGRALEQNLNRELLFFIFTSIPQQCALQFIEEEGSTC